MGVECALWERVLGFFEDLLHSDCRCREIARRQGSWPAWLLFGVTPSGETFTWTLKLPAKVLGQYHAISHVQAVVLRVHG